MQHCTLTFTFGIAFPSFPARLAPPAGTSTGAAGAARSSGVSVFGSSFFRSPEMSQTLTVWSSEAESTRSSLPWNCAHIT